VGTVSDRRTIALEIELDGHPADSETSCVWAGPYVLVIATVLPQPSLAAELHSTFVGHTGVPTCATHMALGPVGYSPITITAEHEHANLDPVANARQCVYEHAEILIETLSGLGYEVGIGVTDDAFEGLERIER
jgi:hypothetical protein